MDMNEQKKDKTNADTRENRNGTPSGGGKRDDVGRSGVYPVSEMEGAAPDAKIRGETSFGQGERGAEGYEDSGTSGIFYVENERKNEKP